MKITASIKKKKKGLSYYQHITFCFPVLHPDLVSYPLHQHSPLFFPIQSFISATTQSSLYTRHHNNHKCSDRFSGTAVRGEASEGESEREREKEREIDSHPPTQKKKKKVPINVHYVPRSCEMLHLQHNLGILS